LRVAVAHSRGRLRQGLGSTPVPGVIVRRLRRTNLSRRGWDIGHLDLDEDNGGRLHLPLCQPALVPGADAGHYTRGRVCSPNARLSARFSEMPSERCSVNENGPFCPQQGERDANLGDYFGSDCQDTAGRVATEYFRLGKVDVVENVRPLKPKLLGNTHFWLER
jgi:hypothetical protein